MHHRTFLTILVLLSTTWAFAQEKSVNPDINKSFKNADVPNYIKRFEREGRDVYDHRDEVVDAMNVKPRMIVADVGAGTGLFTRLFAPRVGGGGTIYAVDISENFIKHIKKTCKEEDITNVKCVLGGSDDVKLPEGKIDLVFICDTYHHFEFPQTTMASVHRALKADGELVVIDFHRIEGKTKKWLMDHVRAGQEVFTKEIESAGFEQIEEKKLLKENYFLRFRKVAVRH